MKLKYLLNCLAFGLAVNAMAATETETETTTAAVSQYRMHSVAHQAGTAQNMFMFWVGGLAEGCSSLYLYADRDPFLFATALSALSNSENKAIKLYYNMDVTGPWGDSTSCELTSFSVM